MEHDFKDVRDFLSGLCAGLDTDKVHWVHGGDESKCWCYSCCYYKARNLRRHDKNNRKEYIVDGGWGTEEDGSRSCVGCGKPLEITLTKSGVVEELEHFLTYGFLSDDDTIHPVTAWELLDVFADGEYYAEEFPKIVTLADRIRGAMLPGRTNSNPG
jgi:hypothetical protein